MQELVGIIGIFLGLNLAPTLVALLLCADEDWSKFWKFFGYGWLSQLGLALFLTIVGGIIFMIAWGFGAEF